MPTRVQELKKKKKKKNFINNNNKAEYGIHQVVKNTERSTRKINENDTTWELP